MKEYLRKLPREIQDLIYLASQTAAKKNMPAYLVGGFVRDLILGVNNLDLDIVVEGDGLEFAEGFAEALKAKLIRHRRFATATIILKPTTKIDPSTSLGVDGERSRTIDIATARSETYPYPASLPVVTPGRLRDDLARRDFTINTMAISINEDSFGKLIDLFKAKEDLCHKKIRVLHDLSFIDDPTRILRAIRISTRYGFKIESRTLRLLKQAVGIKMLSQVHPQRLREEIILILKESEPLRQIRQWQKLVGFSFMSRRLVLSRSGWALLRRSKVEVNWFLRAYPRRRMLDLWLVYFMALLDGLNLKEVIAICKKFVFRKGEEKRILSYKRIGHKFIQELSRSNIKPSRIFTLLEPLSYEVILLIKAKYKHQNIQRYIRDFFEIYNDLRLFISGHDLHGLGIKPGPKYQQIFSRILNARLNGQIRTKEEELSFIRKLVKIR